MSNKNFADQLPFGLDRTFTTPQPIPPVELLQAELTVDGTLGASRDMNVDGSVTPVSFRYIVPAGKMVILHRFTLQIVDGTFDWTGFGGLAALANGVRISIYDADDALLTPAFPVIQENFELVEFGATTVAISPGVATDMLFAQLDFHDQIGYVIYLTPGQYVEVLVQDNLVGLTHMDSLVSGRIIDYPA